MFNDGNKIFSFVNDSIHEELRIYFINLCVDNLKRIFTKKLFNFPKVTRMNTTKFLTYKM